MEDTRMRYPLCLSAMLLMAATVAGADQAVPSAGKTVVDAKKACQIAVPADWTTDTSTGYSPGKKATVTVHGLRAGQTFEEGKDAARQGMKPIKIVQDDAKRLMYTTDANALGGSRGDNGWYVIINTTPLCTASLTFAAGADEGILRKIADSLAVVK
jgi:hypothetical protein